MTSRPGPDVLTHADRMRRYVDELRLRSGEELDYVHEARAQREVAAAFAGSSEYAVPGVVAAADGSS